MPVEVILPKVDMDMSHGTVAAWHVAEGGAVTKGAALFDIETDKAAMEVEAPATGRLGRVTAKPGDSVAVGTVVALIYAEGEEISPALETKTEPEPAAIAPLEVILPKVDMDMSHGTISEWHAAEGDTVTKGAALFDIETDKAAMEVESPASGTLAHILAQSGAKVPVGDIVAYIYPPGAKVGARPAQTAPTPIAVEAVEVVEAKVPSDHRPPPPRNESRAPRATPAARATAREAGILLAEVSGTGPLGRIQRDDVMAWVDSAVPPTASPSGPISWTAQAGPLHVTRREGSGTPLVLIHGFTADSKSWAPLEKIIDPARALIRIDLPGHGRSPHRKLRGFADLSRMIVEALDEATLGIERVHLLGHSLGAALALACADIRSRRVASLTLIAPAGLGPEIDAATLGGIVRATRVESLAPWLRRLTATPEGISDDYAKAAMRARSDADQRAVQAEMAEVLFPDGTQGFDLRAALARIEIPNSVIWGRRDHIIPHRHAFATEGDFALHLLAAAGHVPHIECPARVARVLARHLAGAEVLV